MERASIKSKASSKVSLEKVLASAYGVSLREGPVVLKSPLDGITVRAEHRDGKTYMVVRRNPIPSRKGYLWTMDGTRAASWIGGHLESLRLVQGTPIQPVFTEECATDGAATDHLGVRYPSVESMCDRWGVPHSVYSRRIADGWSVERALTEPHMARQPYTDHTGVTFCNMNEMCHHWGINARTYRDRIRRGWSVERALTTPLFMSSALA